ncbi:MAG: GyrI-like domain-containing protein [Anaerolineales bacterium]|nr:GyrI-like domain-containing protein [Anaerolineales bacterium]
MNYLMMDGRGKPNGKQFPQAAGTLYPLAYPLKWMVRFAHAVDFHVMPMEVVWRVDREKKEFTWTRMLMQPEYVTSELVTGARQKVRSKVDAALLEKVRFEQLVEGTCVQFLHVGPYAGRNSASERMQAFAEEQGYRVPVRNSHDINLKDVRRTKPENLKAVIRQADTRSEIPHGNAGS